MTMHQKHGQDLNPKNPDSLFQFHEMHPSEPLWKRAPTRDEDGRPLPDFMMLIPGLKHKCNNTIAEIVSKLEAVLMHYREYIVFADLNMKINALWVTLKPGVALTAEIAAMIHHHVPEAKLVAQHHD